jgi:hypothetical protein
MGASGKATIYYFTFNFIAPEISCKTAEEISKQELERAVQAFTDSVKITNETLPLLARLIRLSKFQGKIEAKKEMSKC